MTRALPLSKHFSISSPIAMGCMWFGGRWDADTYEEKDLTVMQKALDAALEAKINFFDHADIYGLGKAESVFGEALQSRPGLRENIIIQSKCGIRFKDENHPGRYDFSKEWIEHSVENSLRRLKTDYLDILLLHRPDPLMEPEEVAATFDKLHSQGKVRQFGVSNMQRFQIEFLQSYLPLPLVANQIEINLSRLDFLDEGVTVGDPQGNGTNFTGGTLEHCRSQGIQIQSWGSLCKGLFSGKNTDTESDAVKQTAVLVSGFAEKYACSKEAIILAWLMRHPANIQPVIGTTNPTRIAACSEATNVSLKREDWYALFVSSRGHGLP